MARRELLTDEERRALFGIPADPDGLARCFTPSRSDRDLVAARRSDASRLGYAVQLALLRHPGTTLANLGQVVDPLVAWMAQRLEIPAEAFARYARRTQTVSDHARELAATLGLRPATAADLSPMVEAAAEAARGTDAGAPIAAAVVEALRRSRVILPAVAVVERAAIAGRARARRRATEAVLAQVSEAQVAALGMTPFAWLKAVPVAPKADHVRGLLDRLHRVRGIGPASRGRRGRARGEAGAVRPRGSRVGCPPARALCGAPAPGHPRCHRPRPRGPPDRRGAGHDRSADRRAVRQGAQRRAAATPPAPATSAG